MSSKKMLGVEILVSLLKYACENMVKFPPYFSNLFEFSTLLIYLCLHSNEGWILVQSRKQMWANIYAFPAESGVLFVAFYSVLYIKHECEVKYWQVEVTIITL